jgi:hypothetical chaperone protein
MHEHLIGIDFGTTNSSIAKADKHGCVRLCSFSFNGALTDAYRSLLYLEQVVEHHKTVVRSWTGPSGITRYLGADPKGRLIQSLKSFLSNRSLLSTEVFGRRRTLEELIARLVRDLREEAERQFGIEVRAAVVGRPVRFVGAENESDNTYAETRLRNALQIAGFESVTFEFEPVAAAHYYESTLDHEELILIGDFGGGTSDFSLVRVGPEVRRRGRTPADLLGNEGVGLAGDAFDAKIIRNLISPALGAGSLMRSIEKTLPVPIWVYSKLERWHHLSFLKTKDVMDMLRSVKAQAIEPEKIDALIHLIREDLGYHLHQAVQNVKCQLSAAEAGQFHFWDGRVELQATVRRDQFETWITDELRQIEDCVDRLLRTSGAVTNDVSMVFLTGGTSFVPAVRAIFESRFGAAKLRTGNEFTSVARGLALKAADGELSPQ